MRQTPPFATRSFAALVCILLVSPGFAQAGESVTTTLHFAAYGQLAGARLRLLNLHDLTVHPVEVALGGPNSLSIPPGDYEIVVENPGGHTAWPPRFRAGAALTDIDVFSLVPAHTIEISIIGIPRDEFAGYLVEEAPGTRVLPLGQGELGRILRVPSGTWSIRTHPHTLKRVFIGDTEAPLLLLSPKLDGSPIAITLSMTTQAFDDWYLFCIFRTTNGLGLPIALCDSGGPRWSDKEIDFTSGFFPTDDPKSPIWWRFNYSCG